MIESTPRITGRRLQAIRARWHRNWPLCAGPDSECQKQGLVREWIELDHIVALHKGGADNDGNRQGLCEECHDAKTRRDMGYSGLPPQRIGLDGYPVFKQGTSHADVE